MLDVIYMTFIGHNIKKNCPILEPWAQRMDRVRGVNFQHVFSEMKGLMNERH